MLLVNLIGGLGNQMFQYAFGRSLQQSKRQVVHFDTTELLDRSPKEQFTYRDFELGVFVGQVPLATPSEVALFRHQPQGLPQRAYYRAWRALRRPQVYREQQYFEYDSGVWKAGPNTYYDGYWQSERYFTHHADLIRKAFTFQTAPSGLNAQLAQQIGAQNAISVHVRRGDYVAHAQANALHGTCPPAYYEQAVRRLAGQVGEGAVLYVFSDEPAWVQQHLAFELPTVYVSHNHGRASFEDMRLMSLCRHHIIANSSFSWWGAWLNPRPDKQVVAPRQWLAGVADHSDLIPASWLRV